MSIFVTEKIFCLHWLAVIKEIMYAKSSIQIYYFYYFWF
jgi:hypothetical protein